MEENFKALDWDSNFFGYKVGQLTVGSGADINAIEVYLSKYKKEGFKLIYLKSPAEINLTHPGLSQAGITLADKKVTFLQDISLLPCKSHPEISRYEQPDPDDKLLALALQSGVFSRFKVDTNFKNNEFEKLYKAWITKSINGTVADDVFVSRNAIGNISGFITMAYKGELAEIGLIAVDAAYRRQHLGIKLIEAAVASAALAKAQKVKVVTQLDNKAACAFYQKCGFEISNLTYIYHIWL